MCLEWAMMAPYVVWQRCWAIKTLLGELLNYPPFSFPPPIGQLGLASILRPQPSASWYELDVLAVGQAGRSGDAIAMRYSLPWFARPQVLIIDGGDKDAGARLVDHVRYYYGVSHADHVLNTHPDADHSSGLAVVLNGLTVGALWMHRPWDHAASIVGLFDDGRLTPNSVRCRVEEALAAARSVYDVALQKRIPVYEPFQGSMIGGLRVMSPTYLDYLTLLQHFRATPPAATPSPLRGSGIAGLLDAALSWIPATPANENCLLGLNPTAAENETSVVLFGDFGGQRILLTGDAGPAALWRTVRYAHSLGISLQHLRLLQVPHHGSRNNLTADLLDHITARTAFVSVAPASPMHPRRSVTNALQRRGTQVFATQGRGLVFSLNAEVRPGWTAVEAVPFHPYIEAA
jgi:beta-lactamase superfamily II metal-dependent hydrolase